MPLNTKREPLEPAELVDSATGAYDLSRASYFRVKLFLGGQWRDVDVGSGLPFREDGLTPVSCIPDPHVDIDSGGYLWPAIVEKAFAQVYGNYQVRHVTALWRLAPCRRLSPLLPLCGAPCAQALNFGYLHVAMSELTATVGEMASVHSTAALPPIVVPRAPAGNTDESKNSEARGNVASTPSRITPEWLKRRLQFCADDLSPSAWCMLAAQTRVFKKEETKDESLPTEPRIDPYPVDPEHVCVCMWHKLWHASVATCSKDL